MVKAVLLLSLFALCSPSATAAVLPAPAMYADAVAQEDAVRQALPDPQVQKTVLKAVRTVVAQYEGLVRHYPVSGYADDALWRAAQLSLDAYRKFDETHDGAAAVRLLKRVAAEYPTSRFARRAPGVLATLDVRALEAVRAGEVPRSTDLPRPTEAPHAGQGIRAPQPAQSTDRPPNAGRAPVIEPPAASAAPLATLTRIRRAVLSDVVRVTIDVDSEVTFRQEQLQGPPRVFFDFTATRPAQDIADRTFRFEGDADIIRQIRVGRRPNSTTRVVFDTAGSSDCSASPIYTPYRLVVDCVRSTTATLTQTSALKPSGGNQETVGAPAGLPGPATMVVASLSPSSETDLPRTTGSTVAAPRVVVTTRRAASAIPVTPPLRSRTASALWSPTTPSTRRSIEQAALTAALLDSLPLTTSAIAPPGENRPPAVQSTPPPAAIPSTLSPPAALSSPPAAPGRTLAGGFSMARQLGLGVSRIVIDPGHGGHDPGARGSGATEASLVLDIALRLEQLLAQTPGMEVVLTRRTDQFVSLEERTAIANREGADLFLSIHANASASAQVGGVETYFLNFATTARAASVAARENATSGQAMNALPDFIKAIALNNKLDESRDFATHVQRAMIQKLKAGNTAVRDLGVKQAPFVVLIGASMPSVLAEVSFLTNEQEARLLRGESYRQRIADALCQAIQKYQMSLNKVGRVAQQ